MQIILNQALSQSAHVARHCAATKPHIWLMLESNAVPGYLDASVSAGLSLYMMSPSEKKNSALLLSLGSCLGRNDVFALKDHVVN